MNLKSLKKFAPVRGALLLLVLGCSYVVSPIQGQESTTNEQPKEERSDEQESRDQDDRRNNQEPDRSERQREREESRKKRNTEEATPTPEPTASPTPAEKGGDEPPVVEKPVASELPKEKEVRQPRNTNYTLRGNKGNLLLRIHGDGDANNTDLSVVLGEQFTTDVSLLNQEAKPFDNVRLVVDYNPSFVDPVVINDSPLLDYLKEEPTITVNRKQGQIIYLATLKEPVTKSDTLVFITWLAVKPVVFTTLKFGRNAKVGATEILLNDSPLLGESQEEGDGVVSATVRIIPADPAEALMMQEEPQLYMGSDERIGGIELKLIPPKTAPRVGEEFYVDVVLDNSIYSNMDKMSLMIEFDPKTISIIDDDYDNWITHGLNILDGPFHKQFPFNYHIANAVYPVLGMIDYRVGTSIPTDLVGSVGTVARIRAVGLKPTGNTEMTFFFAPREGMKTTEVKYLGQDSLGDQLIINDGTTGARFAILPELQTSAVRE